MCTLVGSKTKLDDRSGIRNQLRLPSIVSLQLLHGSFCLGVPVPRRIARQIALLDQRRLNGGRTTIVNGPLTCRSRRLGGVFVEKLWEVGPRREWVMPNPDNDVARRIDEAIRGLPSRMMGIAPQEEYGSARSLMTSD